MHPPRLHELSKSQNPPKMHDAQKKNIQTIERNYIGNQKQPALQHSKTSENKDNSLKQAERVIATTKSVNEILNEKLKQAEASIGKLKFEISKEKNNVKSMRATAHKIQNDYIEASEKLKDMKVRAEVAEKKGVDFDSKLTAVKEERDYQVRSYRKFLRLRNILEDYDKSNGLKLGLPDTDKDSEPSK